MIKPLLNLFSQKTKTNVVHWAYMHDRLEKLEGLALTSFPPEPVLSYYYHDVESWFMKCPAFLSNFQNMFVIRCPIDVEITYDRGDPHNKKMNVIKPAGAILDPRFRQGEVAGSNAHEIFSLRVTPYLFWSEQSIMMETINPFLEWDNPNAVRVISGEFNIGKWIRGIEYAIETKNPTGVLKISRGTPLFYVRFRAENPHTKLRLRESIVTPEMKEEIKENVLLKTVLRGCPLEKAYELRRKFNQRKQNARS